MSSKTEKTCILITFLALLYCTVIQQMEIINMRNKIKDLRKTITHVRKTIGAMPGK